MRRGGCRGMGERSSAQEEIAITCFLYLDQERNKRSCLSSYGVISTLAHAPRQRVARADRPKGDRPSRRVDGLARGQAARPREQMVAPREELVLGAAVEVKDGRRRAGSRVAQHGRTVAAHASSSTRASPGAAAVAPFAHLLAHVRGVAVHRLQQRRVTIELKPLVAVDEEVRSHVLNVEAGGGKKRRVGRQMQGDVSWWLVTC